MFDDKIIQEIRSGKIGVIPTDTVYGLACSALNQNSVEKMYSLKNRDPSKPFVFLISNISDLEKLCIRVTKSTDVASKYWPGPVSVILEDSEIPEYMHRGKKSIAVRLPSNPDLKRFLSRTGPLATSSANHEGKTPATNIESAKRYFGNSVDFYVDAGEKTSSPSKIIRASGSSIEVIRE